MDGADGSARFACQITNLHETAAVGDLILGRRLSHIGGAFRFFNLTRDRKAVWTRHQPSVLRMGSSSYVGALDSHVKARADAAGTSEMGVRARGQRYLHGFDNAGARGRVVRDEQGVPDGARKTTSSRQRARRASS